jgi:hypothetical protein|tara:strand:+ start:191 stop:343 length:153 start_codon:yes stop_codon:yes gene_type:complete
MTRYEHTIVMIRCNICDSTKIHWSDKQDDLDLCKECYSERWDKKVRGDES